MSGQPQSWSLEDPTRPWPAWLAPVPYLALAVLVGFTVLENGPTRATAVDVALCGATAVWMLGLVTLNPPARRRPWLMAVFVAGLVGLSAVLVLREAWFGFFTPVTYVCAFRLLRWPVRLLGVAAVAAVAALAQTGGIDRTGFGVVVYLAVALANIIPMCGFAAFAWISGRQDTERRQALAEVGAANLRLAATLAENTALHERLLAQAKETGVTEERQRLAREIHDTLAQGLTGIITQLQAAEQAGEQPDGGWRRHVATATALARESLSEARRSVHALRPEPLETHRLGEALAGVAQRWSAVHGPTVRVTTTGTARPLRPEVEVVLLRAAQEALANVARHAAAGRVGVTLSYLEDEVALDVRDDGCGFDPDAPAAGSGGAGGGFGLLAMRQRIEGLSGTLQVESEPGGGTGISACLPADRAEPDR
jgi:signal transduction histidine kinase